MRIIVRFTRLQLRHHFRKPQFTGHTATQFYPLRKAFSKISSYIDKNAVSLWTEGLKEEKHFVNKMCFFPALQQNHLKLDHSAEFSQSPQFPSAKLMMILHISPQN